jgi:hypothetical protein
MTSKLFALDWLWLANHDVEGNSLGALDALAHVYSAGGFKAKLCVNGHVHGLAALEVHWDLLLVCLFGDVLDKSSGETASAGTGASAEIDEVPAVVVALLEDVVLGVVEQRHEIREPSSVADLGEAVVETPETGAESGAVRVHVFSWWHPDCGVST